MVQRVEVSEQLAAIAASLLQEVGVSGFSTREVARRAGVPHDDPSQRFPSQAALLAAVAHQTFRELRETIARLEHEEADAGAAIQAVAVAYVAYAWRHPALFEVIFRHDLLADSGQGLRASSLPVLEDFTALVRRADATASENTATDLWANVHGIAVLRSRGVLGLIGHRDVDALIARAIAAHLGR